MLAHGNVPLPGHVDASNGVPAGVPMLLEAVGWTASAGLMPPVHDWRCVSGVTPVVLRRPLGMGTCARSAGTISLAAVLVGVPPVCPSRELTGARSRLAPGHVVRNSRCEGARLGVRGSPLGLYSLYDAVRRFQVAMHSRVSVCEEGHRETAQTCGAKSPPSVVQSVFQLC